MTPRKRQPIWESSKRPLYPKCIWIESLGTSSSGYRHFIFDHDISKPKIDASIINEPRVYASLNIHQKSFSCDLIEEDLENLKLIGSADVTRERCSVNNPDSMARRNQSKAINLLKKHRSMDATTHMLENKSLESSCSLSGESRQGLIIACENNKDIGANKNQLVERVLQWLDLAQRNTNKHVDGEERKKKALSKRRVVTADVAHKNKESLTQVSTASQARRESLHHLSLTFNENDTYVAQMRGTCETPISDRSALIFGEFLPTTYRCSRKFLSLRQASVKNRHSSAIILSTGSPNRDNNRNRTNKKLTSASRNKKSGCHVSQKVEDAESAHKAMMRQTPETQCNVSSAKRQLHIFMPNLPKKSVTLNSATTCRNSQMGDCDSCISTVLSSVQSK